MPLFSTFLVKVLVVFLTLAPPHVLATSVQPMIFELQPSGKNARTQLIVSNNQSDSITIEVVTLKSSISPQGVETHTPADDDIFAFPPTAIVKPGQKQVIQVQYIGDPLIQASQLYRVRVSQLPVKLDNQSNSLNFLFNFDTAVNVVPPNSKPNIKVLSIASTPTDGVYAIQLANSGSKFISLHNSNWTVRTAAGSIKLNPSLMTELVDGNYLLPGATRTVNLSTPQGVSLAGISAIDITE